MAVKRLNIGLVTSGFHDDYSSSVCRGISAAAEELDCNLFIFPCRFIDYKKESDSVSTQNLSRQYNTTAAYAAASGLDLVIISTGAIFKDPHGKLVQDFFAGFGSTPVISLAVEVEGYPYAFYDCTDGLTSVIHHLIDGHNCRKLAFIAGPENHPESESRLAVFRNVLESSGIPFEQDNILYSDFSEYSHKRIRRFLKAHSFDFDAVCCANDATASAVYKVLEENGLRPGTDIIVTGYDNSVFASSCIPALTTVSADAADCAYRAAAMGIEAIRTGKPMESLILSTYPVFRESCCGLTSLTSACGDNGSHAMMEMDSYISKWIAQYASHDDPSMPRFINTYSRNFLRLLFNELADPGLTELSAEKLLNLFNDFASYSSTDTMSGNTLCDFLQLAHHTAIQKARSPHIESQVHALFVSLYRILNSTMNTINYALTTETRQGMVFAHNISQHSIRYADGVDPTFTAIMEQLHELGIRRSYLYISAPPRAIHSSKDIKPFDELGLVAYQCGSDCFPMFDEPVMISASRFMSNSYISSSKRSTMYVSPLFSVHEQYGLLVCEVEYQHLSLFQTLTRQICSEIETAYLFGRLNSELSKTTSENLILSKMATRDSLTGCYNRHGFFERAGSAIISPLNEGRHGFLVFSDLNCLKGINDNYGHDDGDFALCQSASAMRECFGRAGIVGRIGGDEFVALMITDDNELTCSELYTQVRAHLQQCDTAADKPYHISMSIGIIDFVCHEDLALQPLIDSADEQQYLDKRNKPEDINK